ncbi:putative transposase [Gluconacetobacter diazotrophicus PA1 5]|nr:putative transposase [Gluconacetobacter diazotrophicus PA1 5]
MIERGGQVLSRCRLSDTGGVRLLELPAWMLDRAACAGMRLAPDPTVSLGALYDLQSLLTGFLSSDPSETVAGFSPDRNRREDHATRRTTALPCGDHIGAAGSVRRQESRSAQSEPDLEGPPPAGAERSTVDDGSPDPRSRTQSRTRCRAGGLR